MSRPPKNSAKLELEKGVLYGKQAARRDNMPKPVGKPRCPKYFNKDQRKVWRSYSNILDAHGLLSDMNGPLLEELAWWEWVLIEMRSKISEAGDIVTSGETGKNPYSTEFGVQKQASEQKQKICCKLGLSSVDAARVGSILAGTESKKSKVDNLLD
jgi:phage terminase small subunit